MNKVKKFTKKYDSQENDIEMIKVTIKDLKSDNKRLKQENGEFKIQIEEMSVKINDFNIYEILGDCKLEQGSIDMSKALVMSLEQKVFRKTALMDERNKKMSSELFELKNNFQDIVNKNGVLENSIKEVKNNFQQLGELVANNNNENLSMMNNIENKTNNMYKELFNKYDEKNNKIESDIQKVVDRILNLEKYKNENNANINNNIELDNETETFLSKIKKRIFDIEQKYNSLKDAQELCPTKEDFETLEKEVSLKINSKDFYELKDKYNIQLAKTNDLEETTERLQDMCDKNSSELIYYTKKIESLTSNVVLVRTQMETLMPKDGKTELDLSKYIDKISFNKHIKKLEVEKNAIENNFEEIRKLMNDISNTLQTKCNADDLKTYENIINNKIEELKLSNNKRFADKLDTNKSMRFLDTQIKHIIDVYIKRLDKNDSSWLIAKKPLGGFSCASCESYLGELKNRDTYLFWNKYPQREKDQNYRVGNGFSRMLNMLNVELKNNDINDKDYESDDEIHKLTEESRFKMRINNSPQSHRENHKPINKNNSSATLKNNHSSISHRSNILPKITSNKNEENSNTNIEAHGNVFGTDNVFEENNKERETIEQPHIVKIVKKSRIVPDSLKNRPNTHHLK